MRTLELDPLCAAAAPLVSWIVDGAKRLALVKRYPKVAAFLIGAALAYAKSLVLAGPAMTAQQVAVCALTILALAVTTHEVLTPAIKTVAGKNG